MRDALSGIAALRDPNNDYLWIKALSEFEKVRAESLKNLLIESRDYILDLLRELDANSQIRLREGT